MNKMTTCMERSKQRMFVRELETVSGALAIWAQERFLNDWSIEDVKAHILNAAKLAGRS
jgi:hypothetical protein